MQKSRTMGGLINTNPMLPLHMHTASTQYIHPSIDYPMVPQRLTKKQKDSIQSPTLCALLGKLNMSSKMSSLLVFLLTKYGGVGLKQWSIINLARQIQLLSTTLSSSIVGFLSPSNILSHHTARIWLQHQLPSQ